MTDDIFARFDAALAKKNQTNERGKPWWDYFETDMHEQGISFDYIGKGLWCVNGSLLLHESTHD